MNKKPDLDHLFRKQDEIMQGHLATSDFAREAYRVISDVSVLNADILTKMKFASDKQDAIASLAADALSPTIVAVRVALWGNMPESLTILRTALENCGRLQFVVRESMYQTAVHEMDHGFNRLQLDKVVSALGTLGQKMDKLHGLISEVAAHATAQRLKWNTYEHAGETFIRVAFSPEVDKAELPLFYAMDVALMTADALRKAYEQDGLHFPWSSVLEELVNHHGKLKQQFSSRFTEVMHEPTTR